MIYCLGEQCPVRNRCLRHTKRSEATNGSGGSSQIRNCTNQKKFVQDEEQVVKGR